MVESSMMINEKNRFNEELDKRAIGTDMRYDANSQLNINLSRYPLCLFRLIKAT